MKVAVICGGHGPERGISLNSARSLCDHLPEDQVELVAIYLDTALTAHKIGRYSLYSNTPSDFDFKLDQIGERLSQEQLISLIHEVDLVFPVIHGAYGEDGQLQQFLEDLEAPFVGASSEACRKCFDKFTANELIRTEGFYAPKTLCVEQESVEESKSEIEAFLAEVSSERVVVKPATGGSSIGVHTAQTAEEAFTLAKRLFEDGLYERVVIEPFCSGLEFTVVILQNRFGLPVSLMPIEIETDYSGYQIFDFRKKYLPTRQVAYHCPPRFADAVTERIMTEAEQLFTLFGMNDFARFDGWLLPDGEIWFSDFNPISGMEQNSFLFVAGARVGLTHADILSYILTNSSARQSRETPPVVPEPTAGREKVHVLFGGDTAERQVSVMSGTNAWLKLRTSKVYDPEPYFLDGDGSVWKLPYALALNHTAEEIAASCKHADQGAQRDQALREKVRTRLAAPHYVTQADFTPVKMSLTKFLEQTPFLFLGLHGGIGEDGTLQRECESRDIPFNGSSAEVCELCVDKYRFGKFVEEAKIEGVTSAAKVLVSTDGIADQRVWAEQQWPRFSTLIGEAPYVVKPNGDGCSAGVCRIDTVDDLREYCSFLAKRLERIPPGVLSHQQTTVEMPASLPRTLLIESFSETDSLRVVKQAFEWEKTSGWVEVTVGVIQCDGALQSFHPSITIASDAVLSVEEKFQGGTGINLTPPPPEYVSEAVTAKARKGVTKLARKLKIEGYARFDAFLNVETGELVVIEANNLPALTPSTVIFQQALAEDPAIAPRELLELIIAAGKKS